MTGNPPKGLASLSLDGRRALITGAGRGLGRALAVGLTQAGAEVVICARQEVPLAETGRLVRQAGGTVTAVRADVTSEPDLERLVEDAGAIDILINNAATAPNDAWQTVTEEDWMAVVALNLWAPFRLCQLFVPRMIEAGWGRVINVASVYGSMAPKAFLYPDGWGPSSYFATKHGIHGVTHYLAARLAPTGVCINSLSPGGIVTTDQREDLEEAEWARIQSIQEIEVPMKRVGLGEDYVAAAVFLASPGSQYMTGQNLVVDGGWSIW